jgi:hypothetical protein
VHLTARGPQEFGLGTLVEMHFDDGTVSTLSSVASSFARRRHPATCCCFMALPWRMPSH